MIRGWLVQYFYSMNGRIQWVTTFHFVSFITIELYLIIGVKPFGPIRRLDAKIGRCYPAFSPLLLYRDEG